MGEMGARANISRHFVRKFGMRPVPSIQVWRWRGRGYLLSTQPCGYIISWLPAITGTTTTTTTAA